MRSHLVHEDGFMRVPVLVLGDLVVRGYTEALYVEAFTPLRGGPGAPLSGGTER